MRVDLHPKPWNPGHCHLPDKMLTAWCCSAVQPNLVHLMHKRTFTSLMITSKITKFSATTETVVISTLNIMTLHCE